MVPTDLQTQLLHAKETATAARRAKGEFLASLSHEVHTAVYSIVGLTDAVLATELKPEQRGDLSAIKESADSLLRMVDDAIDCFKMAEL